MSKQQKLFTLNEALNLGERDAMVLYKEYLNPGLAQIFSLINFDRQYVSAQGTCLYDAQGNEYLDFLGGFGSLNLGHNPSAVIRALRAVEDRPKMQQTSINSLAAALAHNLAVLSPGSLSRTFFCNSGTEAVEGALKLARSSSGKSRLVYCEGSFHGKSMGSLSVTGRNKYRQNCGPLVPECEPVPFGDTGALAKKLKDYPDTAAFIVEPVQGEGGITIPPRGYLFEVRELCTKHNVLLIVDEVQTGLGRTGKMFACEHEDVEPDVLCIAKSFGGGIMPAGAFITKPEIWDRAYGGIEKCTLHTSTFGGNTAAAAAALATLEEITVNDLPAAAAEKGTYLLRRLREIAEGFQVVEDVRGLGLLVGIEFSGLKGFFNHSTDHSGDKIFNELLGAWVASDLLKMHRILTAYTLNNPNVIRVEPPLTVSNEEINRFCEAFEDTLKRNGSVAKITYSGLKTAVGAVLKRHVTKRT